MGVWNQREERCVCVSACVPSHVWFFVILWTVARQASLSMGFSRQGYRSGLPFLIPGDLPDPGIEPVSLVSPALAGGFFTTVPLGVYFWDQRIWWEEVDGPKRYFLGGWNLNRKVFVCLFWVTKSDLLLRIESMETWPRERKVETGSWWNTLLAFISILGKLGVGCGMEAKGLVNDYNYLSRREAGRWDSRGGQHGATFVNQGEWNPGL